MLILRIFISSPPFVVISALQARFLSSGNGGKSPDPVSILYDFVPLGVNSVQKYDLRRLGRKMQPEEKFADRDPGLDLHDTGIAFPFFRQVSA